MTRDDPAPNPTRSILLIVVGALALSVAGCDECEPGQTECDGNTLRTCVPDDGDGPFATKHWVESPCPVACLDIVVAGCASSREPVPECMNGMPAICFDGQPTFCREGYPFPYASCGGGRQCVVSATDGPTCG